MDNPTLTVTSQLSIDYFNVYLNGILHLQIKREEYIGLCSFLDDNKFSINIVTHSGTILSVYERQSIWIKILKEFDQHII